MLHFSSDSLFSIHGYYLNVLGEVKSCTYGNDFNLTNKLKEKIYSKICSLILDVCRQILFGNFRML